MQLFRFSFQILYQISELCLDLGSVDFLPFFVLLCYYRFLLFVALQDLIKINDATGATLSSLHVNKQQQSCNLAKTPLVNCVEFLVILLNDPCCKKIFLDFHKFIKTYQSYIVFLLLKWFGRETTFLFLYKYSNHPLTRLPI